MAKQKFSRKTRVLVDSIIATVFLINFGMLFTGEQLHNTLGIISFILVCIHIYVGRLSCFAIARKKNIIKNLVPFVMLFSLFFAVFSLFASGFALLFFQNIGMYARQIHTVSAYWILLLAGIHIGIYWDRVQLVIYPLRKIFHILFRIMVHAIAFYGVFACFEIQLFEKLFYGSSFEFWDQDRSIFLFFFLRFSILCLSALLMRYYLFFFSKKVI